MNWKNELNKSITTAEQLCDFLALPHSSIPAYRDLIRQFPMQITPYYLSLIDKNDPSDPIARMCIPSFDEFDRSGSFDTSGESDNTIQVGLQHKYSPTVLILSTNVCAMYCRHCFRKRLVGLTEDELLEQFSKASTYVKSHPEINNVLISGGDAFLNPNPIIRAYLDEFCPLPNLDLIRFGTRTPVTLPMRIYDDPELIDLLKEYAKMKPLCVVTQFNHPREITDQSRKAVETLLECGISVRNQAVLLAGVNDDPAILADLFRGLTRINVIPYYLFQCRPVRGVKKHFQVPLKRAVEIVGKARSELSGIAKSFRYVMSHPEGKIEILGILNNQLLLQFHQSKNAADEGRIFSVSLDETTCWL